MLVIVTRRLRPQGNEWRRCHTVGGQNFASKMGMDAPPIVQGGRPPPGPPISMLSAVGPFRGCVKWTKWLHR